MPKAKEAISHLTIITKESQVDELIAHCKKTRYASYDYETTGLKFHNPDEYPLILGVSFQPGSAWIIPLAHKDSPFKKIWKRVYLKFAKAIIENPNIVKVAWNFKFEYKWGMNLGIIPKGRCFDAMLAKYCLDEERPHGLKPFVETFFPEHAGYAKEINKADDGEEKIDWKNIEYNKLCKYCGLDCDLTLRGMIYMEPKLIKYGFYSLFRNMLMMVTKVLAEAEHRGMLIDRKYLQTLMTQYQSKLADCDDQLRKDPALLKFENRYRKKHLQDLIDKVNKEIEDILRADKPNAPTLIKNRELKIKNYLEGNMSNKDKYEGFNFKSPKQLVGFLYTEKFGLRLKVTHKTDSGQPSTGEDVLVGLKKYDKTGFITKLLDFRGLEKLDSTYIRGMYPHLDHNDFVHANFRVNGTVTGRLSCTEPNLQNIPRDCVNYNTSLVTNKGLLKIGKQVPNIPGVYENTQKDLLIKTHLGNWKPITHWVNKGKKKMYRVELDNGEIIKCTMGHQLNTPMGFKSLAYIIKNNLNILVDEN